MRHKKSKIRQKSTAREVEEYIEKHPVTRSALQKGIVNYSALARIIQKELGIKNFEAVLIAIRRNAEKLMKLREHIELKVQKVLRKSNFEIKTKIAVLTLNNDISTLRVLGKIVEKLSSKKIHFHVIQGSGAVTFIIEQKHLSEIKNLIGLAIKVKKNKVEIIIKSPEIIESVPGVVSMIMTAFSERNINALETLSCYTDTILIIEPEDLTEAVKLLEKLFEDSE